MSGRAVAAGLALLAILMVAGVVHIVSVLLVPFTASADAYARLLAATPEGAPAVLPRAGSEGDVLPGRDPDAATAVCRYDLARGPLRVSATLAGESFAALGLHSRTGLSFYGLSDRAADEGRLEILVMLPSQIEDARTHDAPDAPVRDVRVPAPEARGFVTFDVLPRVGGYPAAERAAGLMSCRVEHPL